MTDTETLLDRAAVAARLGIHPDSVTRYRHKGNFPPPDGRLGRSDGWLPETIDHWKSIQPGRTGRPKKTMS